MGRCFSKEQQKQKAKEQASKISDHTIFDPQEPHPTSSNFLVKPPKLAQMSKIQTFQQPTVKAESKLQTESNLKKKVEEFLKNDSVSIFIGSQIKSQNKQKPQREETSQIKKSKVVDKTSEGQQQDDGFCSKREGVMGNNTADLGVHLQKPTVTSRVTLSAIYLR